MHINGIAEGIADRLVERTNELSQGRGAGCIGFLDDAGFISGYSEVVDGGLSGLPFRMLLDTVVDMEGASYIEGLEGLPENAVVIGTNPGKTGLITDTGGINIFNQPMVNIGVKEFRSAGIGVIYPEPEFFDLATRSEAIRIELLAARDMQEEREMLRRSNELSLEYLEMSGELQAVTRGSAKFSQENREARKLPRVEVEELDRSLAETLVQRSLEVGQGREVAVFGLAEDGRVEKGGRIVEGGMGYVPSRLLAASFTDISGRSLRQIYSQDIPANAVVVHTHPGGTGVMHMGDAMAGPGTWGRPIIAIGHDKEGQVRGATVIRKRREVFDLASEHERIGQEFFEAETPQREAELRKRRLAIAQEYTDLCQPVELS